MRGDKNIRDYFINTKVTPSPIGRESHNMRAFLDGAKEKTYYTFYSFEAKEIDGLTNNILNDYLAFIMDNEGCFSHFKFDSFSARHFEFKSRSFAKYLYGDTRLFYFVFLFNDLTHDSDLTYDYLTQHGLIMPNLNGLELLRKIIVFKNKTETISGNNSFMDNHF